MKAIRLLLASTLAVACISTAPLSFAAAPERKVGGVYCIENQALSVLAVQPFIDGLKFGISLWRPNGSNFAVLGLAKTNAGGWKYEEKESFPGAGSSCIIDISLSKDGSIVLKAEPNAPCASHGGYGANLSDVSFPASSRKADVKDELDSLGKFMERGCSPSNPQPAAKKP